MALNYIFFQISLNVVIRSENIYKANYWVCGHTIMLNELKPVEMRKTTNTVYWTDFGYILMMWHSTHHFNLTHTAIRIQFPSTHSAYMANRKWAFNSRFLLILIWDLPHAKLRPHKKHFSSRKRKKKNLTGLRCQNWPSIWHRANCTCR